MDTYHAFGNQVNPPSPPSIYFYNVYGYYCTVIPVEGVVVKSKAVVVNSEAVVVNSEAVVVVSEAVDGRESGMQL